MDYCSNWIFSDDPTNSNSPEHLEWTAFIEMLSRLNRAGLQLKRLLDDAFLNCLRTDNHFMSQLESKMICYQFKDF